jgi:hypothetical protein
MFVLLVIVYYFVTLFILRGETMNKESPHKLKCPNCKAITDENLGYDILNLHIGIKDIKPRKFFMRCPNCRKLGLLEAYDVNKVSRVKKLEPRELYKQLQHYYRDVYSSGNRLEREIESYIRKGLSREEAILEIGINNRDIF